MNNIRFQAPTLDRKVDINFNVGAPFDVERQVVGRMDGHAITKISWMDR